jgi:putative CocE/NonD family hydrolase
VPAVPARNGRKLFETIWGPVDQGTTEDRPDVLVYSTAPLVHPLRFAGPLQAELHVQSDTPASDWVVKMMDVRPDGFAQNLAVGIQRAARRPGQRYRIIVDVGHVAATIASGHILRVEVTGSYFPLYDRNTNTGEGPEGTRVVTAHQRVNHTQGAASRLLLPVVEREGQ